MKNLRIWAKYYFEVLAGQKNFFILSFLYKLPRDHYLHPSLIVCTIVFYRFFCFMINSMAKHGFPGLPSPPLWTVVLKGANTLPAQTAHKISHIRITRDRLFLLTVWTCAPRPPERMRPDSLDVCVRVVWTYTSSLSSKPNSV